MSDLRYDLVIIGSGAGGIAAAIKAKLLGLKAILLEKTPLIGGSSILSGGVLWMPNNPLMQREGIADSREAALAYMDNFVPEGSLYSTPARREAFVDTVDEFITTMESHGMRYRRCHGYADYYTDYRGAVAASRSLEAELFDWNALGPWKKRARIPTYPIPVRLGEVATLMAAGVTWKGKLKALEVAARFARIKLTGAALFGTGGSLQGRMLQIAVNLGCEIWTDAALIDLDMRDGKVVGAHITHEGKPMTIEARRGVLIAAGGFTRNNEMRQKYHQHPISDAWTLSNPGDTGEVIQIMEKAGAGLDVMDAVWWNTSWIPSKPEQKICIAEMMKPHGIVVGADGARFCNETANYMEVGNAIYARHRETPTIPCWFVLDMQSRRKYPFCTFAPGRIPQKWIDEGWVKVDDNIAGLAAKCGIDPAGLEAQIARYNAMCPAGIDAEFGRGRTAYNRYFDDPTHGPNSTMGTIEKGPFWAVPIWPGDVGTGGGAIANEKAEVMRPDGSVIEGLYVAGNSSASFVGPYYIGAGQSIGASSVFAYIATKSAAAR